MFSPKFLFVLIFFYNIGFVEANSRVSFSRPGDMIRIPSIDHSLLRKLLTINFSYEFLSSAQANSSFSIHTVSKSRFQYGISIVKPENPSNSAELGFHFQKNMLVYGNVNFDIGVHDIFYRQGNYSTNGLDTGDISFFAVLNSATVISDYSISTHLGLGTGKIAQDSQLYNPNPEQKIGAFLGFQFKTPFLNKYGGVTFLTEYDGMGLNWGLRFPILNLYQI